jgi:uncharacterized protein (DUF305 family)
MQINIDKKTGIFSGVIVLLVGVIIFMLGARDSSSGFFGMNHSSMMGQTGTSSNSSLLGSDAMFIQMMIPHHQQAVDISDLAIARSKDAELVALAKEIKAGQSAEIIEMKNWLAGGGDTSMMDHGMGDGMGDGMGGMLTNSELSTLKSLSGSKFDVFWLQKMIAHHEGALHMVTMIKDSTRSDIRTFGEGINTVQTAQITQMNQMLKRMGA